jgi:hypothetical protein
MDELSNARNEPVRRTNIIRGEKLEIKSVRDIFEASRRIMEYLISQKKLAIFNVLVDHGEGTISNCMWTPTTKLADDKSFLAVEDYAKIMVLLLTHPKVKELEYNEKEHMITAVVFAAPEMQELDRIENPEEEF